MNIQNKREYGIDTVRTLAALLILSHHITYDNSPFIANIIFNDIGGWALFFFFVISGYFLKTYKDQTIRSINTLSRILLIYVLWLVIYLPKSIHQEGVQATFTNYLNFNMSDGGTYHLWFLLALVFGILAFSLFETIKLHKTKVVLSVIIIIYFLFSKTYAAFIPFELPSSKSPFLIAIPLVLYGAYLKEHGPMRLKNSMIIFTSGTVLCLLEAFFITGFNMRYYFGTIAVVIGIVNIALNKPAFLDIKILSKIGGRYGLGIYLIHPYIIYFIQMVFNYLDIAMDNAYYEISMPFAAFLMSTFILHLVYVYSPKIYRALTGKKINQKVLSLRNEAEEKTQVLYKIKTK